MAFLKSECTENRCDWKNIEEWLKYKKHPTWSEGEQFSHFACLVKSQDSNEKELCLAKVLTRKIKTWDIQTFLEIAWNTFDKQAYFGKTYYKVQIGQTDINARRVLTQSQSSNVQIVDLSNLILLPFPISLKPNDYVKDKTTHSTQSRWIITEQLFQNARNLCFRLMYYAKFGKWKEFVSEYKQIQVYASIYLYQLICIHNIVNI